MVLRRHLHQVEGQTDLQQLGVLLIRRQSHHHLHFHPAKIKEEWYVTFTRSLLDTFQLFIQILLFIFLLCSALLVLFYVTLFRAQQAIQQCVQRALIMAVVLEIDIHWNIEVVKMIYRLVLWQQILDVFLSLLINFTCPHILLNFQFHNNDFFYFSWVEMHQIIKEPLCPLFAAVRHNSQTMDHTSKVQERRDEDQDKHHLHQFKDRRDLHLCVQEWHLHLHRQSQMFLEVGVEIIIRLPHHRHQCNLKR